MFIIGLIFFHLTDRLLLKKGRLDMTTKWYSRWWIWYVETFLLSYLKAVRHPNSGELMDNVSCSNLFSLCTSSNTWRETDCRECIYLCASP